MPPLVIWVLLFDEALDKAAYLVAIEGNDLHAGYQVFCDCLRQLRRLSRRNFPVETIIPQGNKDGYFSASSNKRPTLLQGHVLVQPEQHCLARSWRSQDQLVRLAGCAGRR